MKIYLKNIKVKTLKFLLNIKLLNYLFLIMNYLIIKKKSLKFINSYFEFIL